MLIFVALNTSVYAVTEEALPEIEVRAEPLVEDKAKISIKSESLPAQVQVITKEDIERLNVGTHVDLFRKIPGMYLEDYGQGDIGSAITMRGLGGGGGGRRYVAVFVDGVPQNFPGNGGDHLLSWLTPEMIERIEVIKGPFSALYGNYAIGGAINIITKNSYKTSSISTSGGTYGNVRIAPVISTDKWTVKPFLVYEYTQSDGYRDNSDYKKINLFNKVTIPLLGGNLSLRFSYYDSDWNAPGYLSVKDVKNGVVSRKSTLTPDDGGDSKRYSFVANYGPSKGEQGLYITAYFEDAELNRFVAFPVTTTSAVSQQERAFASNVAGGRIFYNFAYKDVLAVTAGMESRYDDGDWQRFPTKKRQISGAASQDWHMNILQVGGFLQAQTKVMDILKLVGGIRYDTFHNDIDNKKCPSNSGEGDTSIFSPKIGFVLTPVKNVNVFANKGFGFRSPSISELSPSSSTQKKNFGLDPAKADTWDIGFNTTLFEKLFLAFDYYNTDTEREIAFINNEPVNIGNSSRNGYEIETQFYITPAFSLFGSYSSVDAKVKNPINPGQDKVIDVPKENITGGVEMTKEIGKERQFLADLYYYYSGGKYYYIGKQTTPVKGPPYDSYNLKLTYKAKPLTCFISTAYQPRKASSDITWLNGTEIVITPKPIWDLNAGIKYEF
jgi:outer membrane receptor protein involved in Fe transport